MMSPPPDGIELSTVASDDSHIRTVMFETATVVLDLEMSLVQTRGADVSGLAIWRNKIRHGRVLEVFQI